MRRPDEPDVAAGAGEDARLFIDEAELAGEQAEIAVALRLVGDEVDSGFDEVDDTVATDFGPATSGGDNPNICCPAQYRAIPPCASA